MNITLQTSKLNNQQYSYNKPNYSNQRIAQSPSFTNGGTVARSGAKFFDSALFEPIRKGYKHYYEFLGEKIVAPIANSTITEKVAQNRWKDDYFFNHMQAVGSFITSGMYAVRTLQNDNLDKDRRNTLAINQVLTAIISTVAMYAIDGAINSTWEKQVGARYAQRVLNNDLINPLPEKYNVVEDYTKFKKERLAENKTLKKLNTKEALAKIEKPKLTEYMEKYGGAGKEIGKRLKCMDLMRKMFIIGMVYRYIVPVLVVPIANKLGDKYIESKKTKEAATLA